MAKFSTKRIDAAINFALAKFGLESLKEEQKKAIRAFPSGNVSLPTGCGKTYCFVTLPLLYGYLCSSPLPYMSLYWLYF